MTVPVSAERNDYIGNGSTNVYVYGFRITAQTHLLVTVADEDGDETPLTIGTDYTVYGVGVKLGGDITLTSNGQAWIDSDGYLADGWAITIRHVVPLAQSVDIRNLGTYYPETHEDALDYLMWCIKQQQDELNRSVKVGETYTSANISLPQPQDGHALVWDGTDGNMTNAPVDAGSITTAVSDAEAAQAAAEAAQLAAEVAQAAAEAAAGSTALASQAEAEAGTENTKFLSSLRTAQAIAAQQRAVASQAEAEAGSDNTKDMTPLRVAQAIAAQGAAVSFGAWGASLNTNTSYLAASNGFVLAYSSGGTVPDLRLLTEAANPPLTVRQRATGAANQSLSLMCPVKEGEYYKIDTSGNTTFSAGYFISLG